MIRVCHVQLFSIMSGVQRSMLENFSQLDPKKFDVHVICKEPGKLTEELDRLNIPVHYAPHLERAIHPWHDYRAYQELRDIFVRHRYDIVHTHSSKPGMLGRLAARKAGVPNVIHHVHAFAFHEYSARWKTWIYSQLERTAARFCDLMLFVNREECDLVVQRGWKAASDCMTIYNGTDLDAVHPRHRERYRGVHRSQWRTDEHDVAILFMGRLEYPKQPLMLAEIVARLEQLRSASGWRLVIAGSGPEEAALRQAIDRSGLNHRVEFLGWQDDPSGVLHAADIVMLTSLAEGLPRSLIEAQAAGLPIVASAAKGNREVVVPGTGILCDPKNVEQFAQSLATLIDRPDLRKRMGQAGRRHAEACFDTVANHQQIAAVYESLMAA